MALILHAAVLISYPDTHAIFFFCIFLPANCCHFFFINSHTLSFQFVNLSEWVPCYNTNQKCHKEFHRCYWRFQGCGVFLEGKDDVSFSCSSSSEWEVLLPFLLRCYVRQIFSIILWSYFPMSFKILDIIFFPLKKRCNFPGSNTPQKGVCNLLFFS